MMSLKVKNRCRRMNANSEHGAALQLAAWVFADYLYRGGSTREESDRSTAREFRVSITRVRKWRTGNADRFNRRSLVLALEKSTFYARSRRGLNL